MVKFQDCFKIREIGIQSSNCSIYDLSEKIANVEFGTVQKRADLLDLLQDEASFAQPGVE